MTTTELDADIGTFCSRLFDDLGTPVFKTEIIAMMPLKVRVGVTILDVPPETVLAACTTAGMRAAALSTWPVGAFVNCPPKSVCMAADNQHVIFDLVFYHVKIESHLQPKA